MDRTAAIRTVSRAVLVAAALLLLAGAPSVAAHAELDVASPADGETVTGSPPVVKATYTEDLAPDGSSLVLVDASGTEIATGGVASTTLPKEMSIPDLPELAPGVYTVKSTTTSAADGDVDRTTWTFTVVAAAVATPSPAPTASALPSVSAPAASTPASALPSPVPTAAPSPSGPTGQPAAGGSDVVLPIVVGLAIVIGVAVWLARRRGGTSTPT